jgi:hypothetical protein
VVAGLLVRVADDGRTAARKLVWLGRADEVRETADLPGADDTLSAADFGSALADLARAGQEEDERQALEAAFVADTPERLRELFTSQAAFAGP